MYICSTLDLHITIPDDTLGAIFLRLSPITLTPELTAIMLVPTHVIKDVEDYRKQTRKTE